ncbi:MAG TPA: hypothetical protein VHZ26_09905 [Caulobacteraceae bacterium]|jgi:hypothetical protein|nr:hypothetical protein [Caulobacteraceae bacterium]
MSRSLLEGRDGRLLLVGVLLALAALAIGSPARAALNCGSINPHAQVYTAVRGQTPAQAVDTSEHALPWSYDVAQQSGQSSADKKIEADCRNDGGSLLVNIASSEQGGGDGQPGDLARAGWAPTWSARVSLPPHKQLSIAVASNVNYLNCQLVAPGVAANWTIPYSNTVTTTGGVTQFTIALYCTSGGLHDISQQSTGAWVNGEAILLSLTPVDAPRF